MARKIKYRLFLYLMILSGIVLTTTLTITSYQIIEGGKRFTQKMLDQHKLLLLGTLGFGHGVMSHMGVTNYDDLITLALEIDSIKYLALLDQGGKVIARSKPPFGFDYLKRDTFSPLEDGGILLKTKEMFVVAYRLEEATLKQDRKHMNRQDTFRFGRQAPPKPGWFLVGVDTSVFNKHYDEMLIHTLGSGAVIFLFGLLIIIFLGVIQRYELAHLSIEKLQKIKRVLGHFVPHTAKNIIEKEPDKKGLLNKYIQDATILFLDIEGFTLLHKKYSQDRINHVIESYFSIFLEVIQRNEGDINETAGDGMMVIFLHSDPEQHAKNAVQTALDIREECLRVSENKGSNMFAVQVNIGINSGETYLGSTKMSGSEGERWTFTASGEVTIKAARLSQYARNGQIIIGEGTARRTGSNFALEALGKVSLKNIEDPGNVFEVL